MVLLVAHRIRLLNDRIPRITIIIRRQVVHNNRKVVHYRIVAFIWVDHRRISAAVRNHSQLSFYSNLQLYTETCARQSPIGVMMFLLIGVATVYSVASLEPGSRTRITFLLNAVSDERRFQCTYSCIEYILYIHIQSLS